MCIILKKKVFIAEKVSEIYDWLERVCETK